MSEHEQAHHCCVQASQAGSKEHEQPGGRTDDCDAQSKPRIVSKHEQHQADDAEKKSQRLHRHSRTSSNSSQMTATAVQTRCSREADSSCGGLCSTSALPTSLVSTSRLGPGPRSTIARDGRDGQRARRAGYFTWPRKGSESGNLHELKHRMMRLQSEPAHSRRR